MNLAYKDNSPMITVGAVLAGEGTTEQIKGVLTERKIYGLMDADNQLSIGVPPLTLKEKATLDQFMPCSSASSINDVENRGLRLKLSPIQSYHRSYRYHPVFGELIV